MTAISAKFMTKPIEPRIMRFEKGVMNHIKGFWIFLSTRFMPIVAPRTWKILELSRNVDLMLISLVKYTSSHFAYRLYNDYSDISCPISGY
jgi:hypothetical protein